MDWAGYYIFLFILTIVAFGAIYIFSNRADKKAVAEKEEFGKTEGPNWAVSNWRTRAQLLNANLSAPIVYMQYANANEFFPVHVWRDGDFLRIFHAKPTQRMCELRTDIYMYPENLNIDSLKYISCYRQGTQGSYYEQDTTRAAIKAMKAQSTDGLTSLRYSMQAQSELMHAPSRKIEYDDRRTIVVGENRTLVFRIDAFDTIIELFPAEQIS